MRRNKTAITIAMALCLPALFAANASAAAPTIPLTTPSGATTSSVVLEADINPKGKASFYHFEYGLSDCSLNPCTSTPEEILVKGEADVRVTAPIEGLAPGTTYHFRAVAKNSEGETQSPDHIFATYFPPFVGLPDDRAYEQASPIDKNGEDATGTYPTIKASLSGEAISFTTSSGIPGGEGAQEPPHYLSSRGGDDWSTQGILPPESAGQGATVRGWTSDFSQVFVRARKQGEPAGTTAFLSRSSEDGSLATIAPYAAGASYAFAGASSDGSKVFFEAKGVLLTPKAAPGKDNLYLWERDTGELSLVGVLPDGSTPPDGSFAGPYDWAKGPAATERGGAERDYYTQAQHAISSDGSRAYFTASESGQLYLREDPSGAGASTAHVSASQKTNGKGAGGTDAAGPRPAAFMAATPDGATAFFTSSEKLTNNANTGPEPPPAAIARADIDGKNPNQSFLPAHASAVAVDAEHIYWTDVGELDEEGKPQPGEGTIGRAKLDGKGIEESFIAGATNPQGIAVDAEHIYWTNDVAEAGKGEGKGTIGRADLGGGKVEQEFIEGASDPRGIDIDKNFAYWANAGLGSFGFVGRAKLDGSGTPEEEFIFAANGDVAVDATKIYYSRTNFNGFNGNGFIRRAPLDGNEKEVDFLGECDSILTGAHKGPALALDASHLYFTNPTSSAIGSANLDCTSATELIKNTGHPEGLAVDSTHIYWPANQEIVANAGNDLYRYEASSSELTDITVDNADVNGAEVRGVLGVSEDGSHVYFVANGVLSGTPNAQGEVASPGNCPAEVAAGSGTCNLYLAQLLGSGEVEISFIARLAHGPEERTDTANWTPTPSGVFASSAITFQNTARVSADGEVLLFRSQRQLSAYENKGKPELYRYEAGSERLDCVSCNPTGEAPVSTLPTAIFTSVLRPINPASTLSRILSADGDRVFFESTDPLLSADVNGEAGCPSVGAGAPACQDVYMWESVGSGSCQGEAQNGGCLYLISTGKSTWPSFLADASTSGDDVLFFTRERLVGQDGDQLMDIYDARVGGGLASQNEIPPLPCEGEACKPAATSPPAYESPRTPEFFGSGNLKGRKPGAGCPKAKHKVRSKGRTRCVAKRHQRAQRRGRGANTTGEASR